MTPATLAADAAQALQGVTDGPWEDDGTSSLFHDKDLVCIVTNNRGNDYGQDLTDEECEANARFIAFARAWVPEAAAALTALAAQVAELTADRDKWFEGAGAHHVASMKQAQRADIAEAKVTELTAERDDLLRRLELERALTDGAVTALQRNREAAEAKVARLEGSLAAVERLAIQASIASCTCHVKTPEITFHSADCRYVLLQYIIAQCEDACAALTEGTPE